MSSTNGILFSNLERSIIGLRSSEKAYYSSQLLNDVSPYSSLTLILLLLHYPPFYSDMVYTRDHNDEVFGFGE